MDMDIPYPLPPAQNNGPAILAEYYVLLIFSLALVVLRSYVRIHVKHNWGWDDTSIVIAWVSSSSSSASPCVAHISVPKYHAIVANHVVL
jgi:hypothetical protein